MVFPVVIYGCESWIIKTEHWRIDAFELWCWRRHLRVLWTTRDQTGPKRSQPWIFIGRTDAEDEALILWPPDAKCQLIKKYPDAGKDWRQEEKGTTEEEMVGLDGHAFEQALGDGEEQGSLGCCSPWGGKQLDVTEWLNNNRSPKVSGMKPMNKQLRISLIFQSFYRRTTEQQGNSSCGQQGNNSQCAMEVFQPRLTSLVIVYLVLCICKLYHKP